MSILKLVTSVSLAALTVTALNGERRCPGNVETLRYHSLGHSQIAVSVTINKTGPYVFLVDTGSQVSMLEPSLAAELQLKTQGNIEVSAVGNHTTAELVSPDLMEMGSFAVHHPLVVIESLAQIQALDPRIRGLLGGSFLGHFDLLIDYSHKLLCLDETKQMRQNLRGEHVAVIQQSDGQQNLPFPHRLLIAAHIAGEDPRDVLLMLDSGSVAPLLFTDHSKTPAWLHRDNASKASIVGNGSEMSLTALPSEQVRIGSRMLPEIAFLVPASTGRKVVGAGEDGLLPAALFKRVFISYSDHFVILDPR